MTENLKICPFCGSEAEIIGYDNGMYQCVCQNCKSTQGVFYDFPEEAAFAWNNRPIEDLKDDENAWLEKNLKDYNRVMLENARLREALEVILDEAQKDEPCIMAIKVVAYTTLKGESK